MKTGMAVLLLFLLFMSSCRSEDQVFSHAPDLDLLLEKASSGLVSGLYDVAEKGGSGSWFALAAVAKEIGYHGQALNLQIRSAKEDGAPFGLISLSSLLIDHPEALKNPLKILKKAERKYGHDQRLRQARIVVMAARGKEHALENEMEFFRGESWEAPVLAAVLRRNGMDEELKALVERFVLHVDDPSVLLLLPEESINALSLEYQQLFIGRTSRSLAGYHAWLDGVSEPCRLESPTPVFAEMAEIALEAGAEREWATILENVALHLHDARRYEAFFQAGRLYREIKAYRQAGDAFRFATGAMPQGLFRDEALWYRIDTMYRYANITLGEELEIFSQSAASWENPHRFQDVLEEFIHRRVRRGEWKELENAFYTQGVFWPAIERSRLAWILAFAASEGRLSGKIAPKEYLEIACETSPWSWSGLRAAGILDKNLFLSAGFGLEKRHRTVGSSDIGEDDLVINLFLKWGFNHLAADTIMRNPNEYGEDTIRLTAHALADENPRRSIHIVSHLWERPDFKPSREDLILRYPLPETNGKLAAKIAREKGLPPEILMGLVRTESAWDSQAVSRSGATGLAQFMPSTWDEWVRRLQLSHDTGPTDPEMNLTLSVAYLEWLFLREWTFGWLDVLVSYNAGGGRLRLWRRERPGLGEDLFGASLPVEEPRNYIHKVLSAATIYGYLYAGTSPRSLHEKWGLEMIPVTDH